MHGSFRLSEISEPEPDLAVLMPPDSRYAQRLPERREYGTRLTFKAGTAVAPAAFPDARLEWWLD